MINNNRFNHYPTTTRGEEETSSINGNEDIIITAGSSDSGSNKRQKLNNIDQQVDPSVDFLNFDYGFPLDPTVMTQQDPTMIPEDYFMFVTDNEQAVNNDNTTSKITTTDSLTSTNSTSVNTPSPPFEELSQQQQHTSPPQQQQQQKAQPPLQISSHRPSAHLQQQRNITAIDPPNQAVHTIVVGGKPFRLSWESLKSDGPSNFFLEYFRKKKTKVMHIDRDPEIFDLIVRHLRGYYIRSTDDIENQSLLFDATYYGLNRLKKILQEYLYVNVGGRVFRLPWNLFQKDGTHNFFTGPLMHTLLSPHSTDDESSPPIYIDRDPDIFADIVNHLRGYTIHIRDEMHRQNLLRDAQYYVFRQLSDKLLTAQQTVAGFGEGINLEVLLLLQDIRVVNMLPSKAMKLDKSLTKQEVVTSGDWSLTQIQYKRIAEGPSHALLVQVADLCMQIHKSRGGELKLTFEMNEVDIKKMKNMAHIVKATKGVNMEIYLDNYCAITIDDQQVKSLQACLENDVIETNWEPCNSRCCSEDGEEGCQMSRLILQRAICGVHLIDDKITLCALRLEAISSRFRLNLKRQFLSV